MDEASRARYASDFAAIIALAAATVIGSRVFQGLPSFAVLGLIAGLAAGLSAPRLLDAIVVGAVGTLLGVGGIAVGAYAEPGVSLVTAALTSAAVAAVVAGGCWFVVGSAQRLKPLLVGLTLFVIIASGWLFALQAASVEQPAGWVTGDPTSVMPLTLALRATPVQTADSPDETLYLEYVRRTANGEGYYTGAVAALAASNAAHVGEPVRLDAPTSYRFPTLYVLLGALPQNGTAVIVAGLILQALCVLAAYFLAKPYVSETISLASATVIGACFASMMTFASILHADMWGGGLALIAVALYVSLMNSPRQQALQLAAVVAAVMAALVRDLAVAYVLVGFIATLSDAEMRANKRWLPWLGGLALVGGAYAAHFSAAANAFNASGYPAGVVEGASAFPWFHPDGSGLVASINLVSGVMAVQPTVLWIAAAAAALGAFLASRRTAVRVELLLATIAATLTLAVLRTNGETASGQALGFWGMLVLPTVIACAPLALARLSTSTERAG